MLGVRVGAGLLEASTLGVGDKRGAPYTMMSSNLSVPAVEYEDAMLAGAYAVEPGAKIVTTCRHQSSLSGAASKLAA